MLYAVQCTGIRFHSCSEFGGNGTAFGCCLSNVFMLTYLAGWCGMCCELYCPSAVLNNDTLCSEKNIHVCFRA